MLFTCAYCVCFMMFARLVKMSDIGQKDYCKIIRYIIYAYAVVLLIQQLCTFLDIYVPLQSQIHVSGLPYKLNSLSAEPSHTTVILSTAMYFFSQTKAKTEKNKSFFKELKEDKWVWLSFFYIIFTTLNTSAFIYGPLCLFPYINKKNIILIFGLLMIILSMTCLTIFENISHKDRISNIVTATLSLDENKIIEADSSASFRIVPTIRGAKLIDPSDIRIISGYGVDADQTDTAPRPADRKNKGFAGIFSMWHNYGALCALSFWSFIFIITVIKKEWQSIIIFLLAIFLSAEYNVQLIWQLLAFALVFKYSVANKRKVLDSI